MYLVDFDKKLEVYSPRAISANGKIIIPMIPCSGKMYLYDMQTITLNMGEKEFVVYNTNEAHLSRTSELEPIDLYKEFVETLATYNMETYYLSMPHLESYRISFKLPRIEQFRKGMKENQDEFFSIHLIYGRIFYEIDRLVCNTPRSKAKPLSKLEVFQNMPMNERKNLLDLILSKSEENFLLSFNILNLL